MIDLDRWQEIYLTLSHHKLRTSLTAFGVFWGMFMLVVLMGAGRGLERGAVSGFGGHVNTIFLWTQGKTQRPYKGMDVGRWIVLKDEDLEIIKALPEVDLISDINNIGGWQTAQYVTRKDKSGSFETRGVAPAAFPLAGYVVSSGRAINDLDYEERRKVAVIGTNARKVLFSENENPINKLVTISGVNFVVIGTFEPSASGRSGQQDSDRILIPNSTLRQSYNQTHRIGHFQISPKPGFSAIDLEKKVKTIILKNHKVHPEDLGVLGVFNAQKRYETVASLFKGIQIFSWAVAIGTIIAGVIGVGNIMLIIVKERTKEIGVRKALGARSTDIITTIIQESLVLTIFAGYAGLVAGVFALEGIAGLVEGKDNMMFGKPDIDFNIALLALATLIFSGLCASVLPAIKAATVDPIVALQDE